VLASNTDTRLRQPAFATGQGFTFEAEGLPGTPYTLEATTNFLDWVTVSSNTPVASPFPLADPQALQSPFRFYRLKR
jgi:hypothetical protein